MEWTSTVALYGGAALFLVGRVAFLRLSVRSAPPGGVAAAGIALVLLPIARILPVMAALGLLTALFVVLVGYERPSRGGRNPAAD